MHIPGLLSALLAACATPDDGDSVSFDVPTSPGDAAPDDRGLPGGHSQADEAESTGGRTPDPGAEPGPWAEGAHATADTGFDDAAVFPVEARSSSRTSSLDAGPTRWTVTASGATIALTNAAAVFPDGSVLYMAGGKVKLRRPSGTTETVANSGSNGVAITGGPQFGVAYQSPSGFSVAWRGTNGTWTSTSLGYTTGGGSATPAGCVDSSGNGTLALVNSTLSDPEGKLVLFPITGGVVGRAVTYTGDDEATSPSVVCSDTVADEVVWRHQLSGTADIWHATVDAGRITGAAMVLEGAYDPSYAPGRWVGYHVGDSQTYLARSTNQGASFAAARHLAANSKFVTVRTSGPVIAALYSTWPTTAKLAPWLVERAR